MNKSVCKKKDPINIPKKVRIAEKSYVDEIFKIMRYPHSKIKIFIIHKNLWLINDANIFYTINVYKLLNFFGRLLIYRLFSQNLITSIFRGN